MVCPETRVYRTRPSRDDHPEGPVARRDVFEFIARVLDHLPRPRQQMVRYRGYDSNVSRGRRRAAARRGAQMQIIAFILDRASIRSIVAHVRMPAQRPEPLAHSPPLQDEFSYA